MIINQSYPNVSVNKSSNYVLSRYVKHQTSSLVRAALYPNLDNGLQYIFFLDWYCQGPFKKKWLSFAAICISESEEKINDAN